MLVSYNWLKEYVDVDMELEELARRLTMAGLEVGSIIRPCDSWDPGIVVGLVEEIMPHPREDRLKVCGVNVGGGQRLSIVCGAPNVRKGQKVPVIKDGACLPTGMQIKTAVVKGVESQGMICSAQELGLDPGMFPKEQQEGILELPADSVVGIEAYHAMGLDDDVFDIELTPNRADCMSIVNTAREVAAICGSKLNPPDIGFEENPATNIDDMIAVEILDPDLCGRYTARAVVDIKISPSPSWMQNRLRSAGVRPINNIVDVTNYVMMEMGQPLHAFDYRFLEGKKIIVRRAKPGETMVTLDGQERELDPNMLVIADVDRAVAVAGVMGGENSEVVDDTSVVLIESANFNPSSVRRTSKELGLRSESSIRFERGVNIEGALRAAERAAQLMAELGGGRVVSGSVDNYPVKWEPITIELRVKRANDLLGLNLETETITDLLTSIELDVKPYSPGVLAVGIPPFRRDLEREIDLVEEIARLYGYDKIPTSIPRGDVGQVKKNKHQVLEEKTKDIMVSCGLNEVITFSFHSPRVFDKMNLPADHELRKAVRIANPLGEEQGILRTSIVPNLLEVARRNVHKKTTDLAMFEFGKVFLQGEDIIERPALAALVTGKLDWGWGWKEEKLDFFFLKGVLEQLLADLNITGAQWQSISFPGFHPGRTAEIVVRGQRLGHLGEIHPEVIETYELPSRATAFEIDFDTLVDLASKEKRYQPLVRYPSAQRDIALIVPERVTAAEVDRLISSVGGDVLQDFRLFDVYRGEQIPEGKKGLAYSLTFQAEDRTLTDEEVDAKNSKIREALAADLDAEFR